MRQLPRTLAFLDRYMKESGTLRRLGPRDLFHGTRVCEADYDELIVGQLPSVADCLREAGLLGDDHDLLHIGNQIENIDVLCAEVDQGSKAFHRFVVIEDKLCRNPEGRRDVLGQIVDYSKSLHELDFDDFVELVPEGVSDWCEAHRVAISRALAERRMLLLICSDQVRESLIEYARFLNDVFPLQQMELALVSLNIYSDGERHLFVPNVAGIMPLPKRTLVVKVEVTGQNSEPVNARISADWQMPKTDGGRRVIQESELFDQIERQGAVARAVAETLLRGAEKIGAEVEFGDASAKARIYNSSTRRPATLFVVTRRGTFYVRSFSRWLEAAAVGPELSAGYLQKLTDIVGKSPQMARGDAGGRRALKLDLLKDKESQILGVVEEVIPILRDSPAPEEPEEV
jgi:hypothetical protein